MRYEFKARQCRSWLDPKWGKVFARELGEALVTRCQGESGVFLTLTYRREDYEDARDLYHRAKEERHVRRFIARLAKNLGTSLSGRWLCKLEFQRGGWVHWHLVVLGVGRIEHELLERTWGHGFVWIKRLTPTNIRYTCKYIAKDGAVPVWLWAEKPKSFKVVRCSPGFWGDTKDTGESREPWPDFKVGLIEGCYVPIGHLRSLADEQTTSRNEEGAYRTLYMPVYQVATWLMQHGVELTAERGWLVADLRPAQARALRDAARPAPQGRAGGGSLHLKEVRNPPPDQDSWSWQDHVRSWLCDPEQRFAHRDSHAA